MILAPLVLAAAAAAASGPPNLCAVCHPDVRVAFEKSIHHAEEISCTSCHGGDASATTVEKAHGRDFKGVPRRRDIPALCASCHADIVKMKVYNLPADQYALYQTSRHGMRLAQGDEKVAVCTDCHGVHEILAPSDPASRVNPRNIPATCGKCHGDAALMSGYGLKGNPYKDYVESVHGKALLVQGNLGAPQCARCHGAHGATPPGVGSIDKLCGQCHVATRGYFAAGPHRKAMIDAGLPECESCHGHHRIEKTDIAMLDTVCVACHDPGSPEARRGVEIKTLYTGASEQLDRAGRIVQQAATIPLYVEDYQARLEEARTALLETHQVQHTVDTARVEELTRRARSIGEQIESELTGKIDGLKWRRVGLLLFWFYLITTIVILLALRRRAAGTPS